MPKNKTIRTNVFETNSSSTHALTVCTDPDREPNTTLLVPKDGSPIKIHLGNGSDPDNGIFDKIAFILNYCHVKNDEVLYLSTKKTIEDFTGVTLEIETRNWNDIAKTYEVGAPIFTPKTQEEISKEESDEDEDDEDADDEFSDKFGYFINEYYGHENASEFRFAVEKYILASAESLISFVFTSSNGFEKTGYYEG